MTSNFVTFLEILGPISLVILAILEIYASIPPRSGKYYKPWKSSQKVVVVSSKKHIMELSEASELSQRAIYADMFGFKHTMNGYNHPTKKVTIVRSRLFARLLHVKGPGNLEALFPSLQKQTEKTMGKHLQSRVQSQGFYSLPLASTVRDCTSKLMSSIFFGEIISQNSAFSEALLQYPKDMVASMAAYQLTPKFLASTVHAIITKNGAAMRIILDQLAFSMGEGKDSWDEPESTKRFTIMQNMTELTEESRDYWTPDYLAQALLGIWFAAAHQPWMNLDFVVLELCSHPEYIQLLRDEIGDFSNLTYSSLESFPILDGFIKETVRLNPLDTRAIRRKALSPFRFSDGPEVPVGAMACVSSFDLMHNPNTYPDPYKFNGQRFITSNSEMKGTKFTDISEKFPVWGYGSLACPGRFHASIVMKLVIAYLVSNFDLRLENKNERVRWMWETFTMPYEKTRILVREREL